MRSVAFGTVIIIGLLAAGLFASAPRPSAAFGATPPASPTAGTPTPPADICSPAETANASLIEVVPSSIREGVFSPFNPAGSGERMFLVTMTMPPNTCYAWRKLPGMVMLLVQEGQIAYTARDAGVSPVQIMKGDNDGSISDTVAVSLDTAYTVRANEWITQNREVWFTFRNAGSHDAVLSLAYYGANPWDSDTGGCGSVCRKP
jgi:hypothetical protein